MKILYWSLCRLRELLEGEEESYGDICRWDRYEIDECITEYGRYDILRVSEEISDRIRDSSRRYHDDDHRQESESA